MQVNLDGASSPSLSDPLLNVYDANGALLVSNDDVVPGIFDSELTFTELEFNIVTDAADADLFLVLDTNEVGGEFLGYFNPPGTRNEDVGVFDATLWDRSAGGDMNRGSFGYVTVGHGPPP